MHGKQECPYPCNATPAQISLAILTPGTITGTDSRDGLPMITCTVDRVLVYDLDHYIATAGIGVPLTRRSARPPSRHMAG